MLTLRPGSPFRRILRCEVVPDPGGAASFGLLVLVVAAYLVAVPDSRGNLAGPLLGLVPEVIRSPRLDAAVEGLLQAFLLIAPGAVTYAGLRHLLSRGDSLLPYLTVAGGGLLMLVTIAAVIQAALAGGT